MKRSVDRYFEGYTKKKVPKKNGKGEKTVYVYEGDYYRHDISDSQWKMRKVLYIVLTVVYAAVLLFVATRNLEINRVIYTAYPSLFAIIPLILLAVGAVSNAMAKRDMTVREYRASTVRIMYSSIFAAILAFIAVVGNIVYLIVTDSPASMEWIGIPGYVICTAIGFAIFVIERKTKFTVKN